MREGEEIVSAYRILKSEGIPCVLATVVRVEGSSYRRAGARMLVDQEGRITGAISGGCLEGDALRKALLALEQGNNKLVTYDTRDEAGAQMGAQLGCQGVIHVLFEPQDYTDPLNACELLDRVHRTDRPCAIGVGFDPDRSRPQPGTSWIQDELGQLVESPSKRISEGLRRELARQALDSRQNVLGTATGESGSLCFVQYYRPPWQLLIVGAGNDARILASQALLLGWRVTVADGRPSHARRDRFAAGCQVVLVPAEQLFQETSVDNRTAVVLMSHNYHYDRSALKELIQSGAPVNPYIGILGPRSRFERMKDDLALTSSPLPADWEARIYAPVGLDIGAETPAEIGLSILAEIQAVLAGSSPGHLRNRKTPIHVMDESNPNRPAP